MAGFGPQNSQWKGGRKLNHGYVLVLMRDHPRANVNGYVREHILIMEDALGHCLLPNQIIHHINGDRADNRLENLQIMTQSEHASLHRRKEKSQDYEHREDWITIWRAKRAVRRVDHEKAMRL